MKMNLKANKFIIIAAILAIFSLVATAVQAASVHEEIELSALKLGGVYWATKLGQGTRLSKTFAHDGNTVRVDVKYNDKLQSVIVFLTHTPAGSPEQTWHYNATLTERPLEYIWKDSYTTDQPLGTYVDTLLRQRIFATIELEATDFEPAQDEQRDFPCGHIEDLTLIFTKNTKMAYLSAQKTRAWQLVEDKVAHKSKVRVFYNVLGRELDDKLFHDIFVFGHESSPAKECDGILCYEGNRFKQSKRIEWDTIPENLKKWAKDSGIDSSKYFDLESDQCNENIMLCDPRPYLTSEELMHAITPPTEGIQYYRKCTGSFAKCFSKRIYYDGEYVSFCWINGCYLNAQNIDDSKNFSDQDKQKKYAIVVKSAKQRIPFPASTETLQFTQQRQMAFGFNQLAESRIFNDKIQQIWRSEDGLDEARITLSGLKQNSQWASIKFSSSKSVKIEETASNKLLLDITSEIATFSNSDWDILKNALLMLSWASDHAPILRVTKMPVFSAEHAKHIGRKVRWLLKETGCVSLEFSEGIFLKKKPGSSPWSLENLESYHNRDQQEDAEWLWALNWRDGEKTSMQGSLEDVALWPETNNISELALPLGLPKNLDLLEALAFDRRLRTLLFSRFDGGAIEKLKFPDAHISALALKARGLTHFRPYLSFSKNDIYQVIENNLKTIINLNLSHLDEVFFSALRLRAILPAITHLESLNISHTNMSNEDTVELVYTLYGFNFKLKELSLTMPYTYTSMIDCPRIAYTGAIGALGGEDYLLAASFLLTLPIGIPMLALVGLVADWERDPGYEYRRILEMLCNMLSLERVELQLLHNISYQKDTSKYLKQKRQQGALLDVKYLD